MKYYLEFKQAVIAYYAQGHSSLSTAKHFSISDKDVSKWLAQFDLGGIDAIKSKQNKTIYTAEFKYNVLTTMQDERLSFSNTSLRFGISSPSLISVWRKIYQTDGMLGLEPKSKGRVSMSKNKYIVDKPDHEKTTAELQRELLYLRAENVYLKKLDALLNINAIIIGK
ncbi:helix-turn-helix domain-containing protein [Acinetobacter guillouiae]|uniref:helix-turn-helix domain-containing protein n=1 Tax=Acinetobacter guillouiae TaxID=106649 RepID=UPI0028E70767|nr:helix-turn-helix domain-containing protein [Acinetobacter guillouiae]